MVGRRISHYEVLGRLGKGGMGEVWKAEDTRLRRTVALKFLSPEAVGEPETKARLVREAQAAASLDHPNICHVYGIDEEAGETFIAMAFVDGPSLAEKIRQRPLPLDEALEIAIQVAEGLREAHENGVVHRDIKPANVMLTPKGQVKIMDFGLASLAGRSKITKSGTTLGTPAYMAPEQLEAAKVDHRADIWALGCVLYETLTQKTPFDADYEQAIAYGILNEAPEPVTALRAGLSTEIDRVLTKTLAKTPDERYQTVGDLLVDLRGLRSRGEQAAAFTATKTSRPNNAMLAAAGVALALAGIALGYFLRPAPTPTTPPQYSSVKQLTYDQGLTFQPALSPDGRLLAYSSDRDSDGDLNIWVQQVGSSEAIRLTDHPADDHAPVFSPDGKTIAFSSTRHGGGVYAIDVLGGRPRQIAEGFLEHPRFSPDGEWIAFSRYGERISVYRAPSAGGVAQELDRSGFDDGAWNHHPVWSPDGSKILFFSSGAEGRSSWEWWVSDPDGGAAIRTGAYELLEAAGLDGPYHVYNSIIPPLCWLPDTEEVLFRARLGDSLNIWAVHVSPVSGKAEGPLRRVTNGPGHHFSATADSLGRIAFSDLRETMDLWAQPVGANGAASGPLRRITDDLASVLYPSVSRDGARAVFISARNGQSDVWIVNIRSGEATRITNTSEVERHPLISPEGSRVAYSVPSQDAVYITPVAGGTRRVLLREPGPTVLQDWSSDGAEILFRQGRDLRAVEIETGELRTIQSDLKGSLGTHARLSPDRDWLAYFLPSELDRGNVWVSPARTDSSRSTAPKPIGPPERSNLQPIWGDRADRLFFIGHEGGYAFGRRHIYTQRLDPSSKDPLGAPTVVQRFPAIAHTISRQFPGLRLDYGGGNLVFNMTEFHGNIWLME